MYYYQKTLFFSSLLFVLSFLPTASFAAVEKIAILKKDANARGLTLQIYNPPMEPESDTGPKLFEDVYLSGNIADLAAEKIDRTKGDEFIFMANWNFGINSLHIYRANPEANSLFFHLLADDRYLGRNAQFFTTCDCDSDSKKEAVVIRKRQDENYKLAIYNLPTTIKGNATVIVSIPDIGKDIAALSAGDMDGDEKDELVITRKNLDGTFGIEIYQAPTPPSDTLGLPSLSYDNVGKNVIPNGLAIGDFDNDLKNEIAVVRLQENADHSLEIFNSPLTAGDEAAVPIASDLSIGKNIAAITSFNEGAQDSPPISVEVTEPSDESGTLPQEQELINLINQERQKNNLSPLTTHNALVMAAKKHSEDMAQNNFISHTGSDGSTPFTRITDAGYQFRSAGENIAVGQTSPQTVLTAWMNSSGHRRNILNTNYCELGVGYVNKADSTYRHYWTLTLGCQ